MRKERGEIPQNFTVDIKTLDQEKSEELGFSGVIPSSIGGRVSVFLIMDEEGEPIAAYFKRDLNSLSLIEPEKREEAKKWAETLFREDPDKFLYRND